MTVGHMPFLAATTMPPLFALLALMLIGVVVVSLLLIRMRQSLLVGYFLCGVFNRFLFVEERQIFHD